MKTINKNNKENVHMFRRLTALQSTMMLACLEQGLNLSSNIMQDSTGGWVFTYGVGFHNDGRVVFAGQAQAADDEHYNYIMALIRGEMVSELTPPSMKIDGVSYWKRHLITDVDVTDLNPQAVKKTPAVKSIWVGYHENGNEMVRIVDGTKNRDVQKVGRIEYVNVPTRGLCVFVVPFDYTPPKKDDYMQGMTACSTVSTSPTMAAMTSAIQAAPMPSPTTMKLGSVSDLPKPTPGQLYTVRTGDTLSQISMDAYGRDDYVFRIQETNPELIKDIDLIFPGNKIMIPILIEEIK